MSAASAEPGGSCSPAASAGGVLPPAPASGRRRLPSRWFLLVLRSGAALAAGYLVWPIAQELLFGAVLAAAGAPLYERLARRLRGHRAIAAVVFTALVVLLVVTPIAAAVASAAAEVMHTAQRLGDTLEARGIEGLLEPLPDALRAPLLRIQLDEAAVQERMTGLIGRAVTVARVFLRATTGAAFSLALTLIALVVFLVDGARLVRWLDEVVPLGQGEVAELLLEFRRVGISVVVGNFGTSAVQALVALVGYVVAQAPSPALLTLTTFLLSFVPSVGGAATTLLVALGLGLLGSTWHALFLAVWAVAVVGLVDNIVKPLLVSRGVKLHGAVVFFSILAGVVAFGPGGLLFGPLIVTLVLGLLRFNDRERTTNRPRHPPWVPLVPMGSGGVATTVGMRGSGAMREIHEGTSRSS